CHNPWTGHTIAFTLAQLDRDHHYSGVTDNQVRALEYAGLIERVHNDKGRTHAPLADPYDQRLDLTQRARSYLQVNCAHCHQFGPGGTADLELRYDVPLEQTKTVEVRPVQGTFGIPGAQILAPGDPYRSVLYYRMAKLGPGRMPHIGSEVVDERGVKLIHARGRQLAGRKGGRLLLGRVRSLRRPGGAGRREGPGPAWGGRGSPGR